MDPDHLDHQDNREQDQLDYQDSRDQDQLDQDQLDYQDYRDQVITPVFSGYSQPCNGVNDTAN